MELKEIFARLGKGREGYFPLLGEPDPYVHPQTHSIPHPAKMITSTWRQVQHIHIPEAGPFCCDVPSIKAHNSGCLQEGTEGQQYAAQLLL